MNVHVRLYDGLPPVVEEARSQGERRQAGSGRLPTTVWYVCSHIGIKLGREGDEEVLRVRGITGPRGAWIGTFKRDQLLSSSNHILKRIHKDSPVSANSFSEKRCWRSAAKNFPAASFSSSLGSLHLSKNAIMEGLIRTQITQESPEYQTYDTWWEGDMAGPVLCRHSSSAGRRRG